MADRRSDPDELYVSCRPQRPPRNFCVEPGHACLLQACGLAEGQEVPVLKCYGDGESEPAIGLDKQPLVLSAECPNLIVNLPGNYKLDVSALSEDPCVYITEQCMDLADAGGIGMGCQTIVNVNVPEVMAPRCVTAVGPVTCFTGPEPECALYERHVLYYSLDPKEEVKWTCDGVETDAAEIPPIEEMTMLKVSTTGGANGGAKTCETLDCPVAVTEPLEGTVADLIALAGLDAKEFPTFGPASVDDLIAITGQAAGPITYGTMTGDTIEDTEGVTLDMPLVIPEECLPANFNLCLRKCLSAAEIKALA